MKIIIISDNAEVSQASRIQRELENSQIHGLVTVLGVCGGKDTEDSLYTVLLEELEKANDESLSAVEPRPWILRASRMFKYGPLSKPGVLDNPETQA